MILLCLLAVPSYARDMHYSSFSDEPKKFLDVIKNAKTSPNKEDLPVGTLKAGIITHHFLASGMMVDFFKCVKAGSSPRTIIIIGPDHYNKGVSPISISSLPWKTPFGMLYADKTKTERISNGLSIKEAPEAFSGEHSIGILVPFIKYYFPKSKIVPIIIRPDTPRHNIDLLAKTLAKDFASPDTFTILSMDFSHDTTLQEADKRDSVSKAAIARLDPIGLDKLNVDCPKGLYLLMGMLNKMDGIGVFFRDHSNSEAISGQKDQDNVTSYFSVLFLQKTSLK